MRLFSACCLFLLLCLALSHCSAKVWDTQLNELGHFTISNAMADRSQSATTGALNEHADGVASCTDDEATSNQDQQSPSSCSDADDECEGAAVPASDHALSTEEHDLLVAIEAFGSGVLLHAGLAVARTITVRELKSRVKANVSCPARTRTVRLFVGHGGTELDDDELLVAVSPLAENPSRPLVMFPVACKLFTSPVCAYLIYLLPFSSTSHGVDRCC